MAPFACGRPPRRLRVVYIRGTDWQRLKQLERQLPRMTRYAQYGLVLVLLSSSLLAFSQGTFQKLLLDAWIPVGHNAQPNALGGVTFTCWTENRFGASGRDVMLVSLDDHGDTIWTRVCGREFDDLSFSLLGTADGGYLVAGTSRASTCSLDPLRTLLIKINALGDTLWTRTYLALYEGLSAIQCQDGGFLIVGNPIAGFYMVRVNAQGALVWSSGYDRLDPPDFDHQFSAYSVAECTDGGFLVVGGRDNGSAFLSKVSVDGVLEWTKLAATDTELLFKRIVRTTDGGFIILGGTNENYMLMKVDSLGDPLWTKAYAPPAGGWGRELITTSDGGYALIGGTDQPSGPTDDVYFLKTDSVGDVLYSGSFGDVGWDVGASIVEAPAGGYFLVAWSESFGPNSSIYVIKTDSAGRGDCYYQEIETTVSTVEVTWSYFELEALSTTPVELNGGFMMSGGASILPVCPVGVNSPDYQNNSIQLYPNPAHDQFTIAMASHDLRSEIEIFNAQGKKVYQTKVDRPEIVIDCALYPSGIYLVKVTTVDGAAVQRVILD